MAKFNSTRPQSARPANRSADKAGAYQYMLQQITRRAFQSAFNEALTCAAALNPGSTVQRTVTDYLESMSAQVAAHERTWQEQNAQAVRS